MKSAKLHTHAALFILVVASIACSRGLPVTATYRGFPKGMGDPVRQRLGDQVTRSFTNVRTEVDSNKDVIKVIAVPTKDTVSEMRSAGFKGLGPCLPDGTTYSYYVLRIFDTTGQLIGVSQPADTPVICRGGSYDFSPLERDKIEVNFPANAALLRDAKKLEFCTWFEPLGERGVVSTDLRQFPPSWRAQSQENF